MNDKERKVADTLLENALTDPSAVTSYAELVSAAAKRQNMDRVAAKDEEAEKGIRRRNQFLSQLYGVVRRSGTMTDWKALSRRFEELEVGIGAPANKNAFMVGDDE